MDNCRGHSSYPSKHPRQSIAPHNRSDLLHSTVQCREPISILHIQTCPCAYESGSGSGTAMAGSSVKRCRPCIVYGIRICAPPPVSLQQGTYTLVAVGEQYVSHVGSVRTVVKRCRAEALVN